MSEQWDKLDDAMILWTVREYGVQALTTQQFARYLRLSRGPESE